MKYMLIMRETGEKPADAPEPSFEEWVEAMGRFNGELISAGVLIAAEGLDDPDQGVVVDYGSQPPIVTDGPYGETKELFGGYWILDVPTIDDAVEWAKRVPLTGPGTRAEIRRITSMDDIPAGNEWTEKERDWREATGQL
ncbi:YciI family protein [Kribbella sp. CA-247076]|uniref:YciI family protein n=1 Tax=Kribbella sp. CA-247076 TaxID=3239941 RepID=UPI003D8CB0B5